MARTLSITGSCRKLLNLRTIQNKSNSIRIRFALRGQAHNPVRRVGMDKGLISAA